METESDVTEGGEEGFGFLSDLGVGPGGEAGPEEALDRVEEDVEGVGVAEEEGSGLVGEEEEVATGEGVEEGDGAGGVGLGDY